MIETWSTKKLGEVCDFVFGYSFRADDFNESGDGLPVIRIGDIDKGITKKFYYKKYNNKYLVNNGEILIGLSGSIKVNKWKGKRALLNQRIVKVHNFTSGVSENFVFYQLPKVLKRLEIQISQGTVKNVLLPHLFNLQILVPSLSIQQKIIERLNEIRKAQELNEKQISLANELFQSLLHQELKPKKNWQTKKLKEVAAIHYGKGLTRSERKENGKIFAYGSNGPVYKTDKILINSPTIVIGRKGAVGAVHLVETPCWPIDTTFYTEILDSNLIDLKFLYFALRIKKLEKMAIVTAVPGINRDHLYNITLCIPSIIIQHQIVKKLSIIQEYKKKLLKQKELLQELFEKVLHKCFSGENL